MVTVRCQSYFVVASAGLRSAFRALFRARNLLVILRCRLHRCQKSLPFSTCCPGAHVIGMSPSPHPRNSEETGVAATLSFVGNEPDTRQMRRCRRIEMCSEPLLVQGSLQAVRVHIGQPVDDIEAAASDIFASLLVQAKDHGYEVRAANCSCRSSAAELRFFGVDEPFAGVNG